MAGLDSEIGILAPGRSADIGVLSAKHEVIETFLRGEPQMAPSTQDFFNG
jgi:N-acetylglucosamine-6-phosphate deacetylase